MKWLDRYIDKSITGIVRIDNSRDYEFYSPCALFLLFDEEAGLLLYCQNDGKSIGIEHCSLAAVKDEYVAEFNGYCLNELNKDDELNSFIRKSMTGIKVGNYKEKEIIGDSFIIAQGKYSGIIVETASDKFVFYNNSGGCLWINDDIEFPGRDRWFLT